MTEYLKGTTKHTRNRVTYMSEILDFQQGRREADTQLVGKAQLR